MALSFGGRLTHAWNVLTSRKDELNTFSPEQGASFGSRPDVVRYSSTSDKALTASIYTRISIDGASVDIRHARQDENERYIGTIKSGLNNCLNLEANLDQGSREFKQDLIMTMLDKGVVAAVPIETSLDPENNNTVDINTMRIGEIVSWMPQHVTVRVWNEYQGRHQDVTMKKTSLAIIYNPLYAVMNEPNSTLRRLANKLGLLDRIHSQSSSGKLDMIIQLPYVIKNETRRAEAEKRRKDIEVQLIGSKHGIAYTDGTEKIIQLNRPVENNLPTEIADLRKQLYSELGLSAAVFDGSASEEEMLNYHNRTVEPILGAIKEAFERRFISKTARTQGQTIMYFRDPFALVTIKNLAELADKLTRNEIVSTNEFRGVIGFKPSDQPRADDLVNKNLPQAVGASDLAHPSAAPEPDPADEEDMNAIFDDLEKEIDGFINGGEDAEAEV